MVGIDHRGELGKSPSSPHVFYISGNRSLSGFLLQYANMPNTLKLIVSIVICQMAGVIVSFFTASAVPVWYAILEKPSFSPPNWLFAPVWFILYALMGISLFLVWRHKEKDAKGFCNVCQAMALFLVHLVVNALWSVIFFGLKNPFLAFLDILLLLLLILLVFWQFQKIDKIAAYLLTPYAVWVVFAAILNFSIWQLN